MLYSKVLRHFWLERLGWSERYPVYVPPEVMRAELLRLLDKYDNGHIPKDQFIGNVVLEPRGDDKWEWICFRKTDTLDTWAMDKFKSWAHVCLANAVNGHATLWCQNEVVDRYGVAVPREERLVLDPEYLASWAEAQRPNEFALRQVALRTALCDAPVVVLKPGGWRDASGTTKYWCFLLSWRKKLAKAIEKGEEHGVVEPIGDLSAR